MGVPHLKSKLTTVFNQYIRLRDVDDSGYGFCISCGSLIQYGTANYQAGHYYPAPVESLRFNEFNVNGQCKSCNYFKSGNLIEYRKGLIKKIGEEKVIGLELIADMYKSNGYRHDRFSLEVKIKEYKQKLKDLKRHKMFKVN